MWSKLRVGWVWVVRDHPRIAAFTDWLVKVLTAAAIVATAYVYFSRDEGETNPTVSVSSVVEDYGKDMKLLVIHVKPINLGKVPVTVGNGVGGFKLTVKKVPGDLSAGGWLEKDKLPAWRELDLLRHDKDGYILEPNASYDEVEALPVAPGIYLIEALFDLADGDYVNASSVVTVR